MDSVIDGYRSVDETGEEIVDAADLEFAGRRSLLDPETTSKRPRMMEISDGVD